MTHLCVGSGHQQGAISSQSLFFPPAVALLLLCYREKVMLSIQDQPEGQGEELNADSALLAMATRGWQSMRLANPKILSSVA